LSRYWAEFIFLSSNYQGGEYIGEQKIWGANNFLLVEIWAENRNIF
jgi:hypothetical protein